MIDLANMLPPPNPNLKEIRLSPNIIRLTGYQTIYGYENLTTINFPKKIKTFSFSALSGCPNLEFIRFEKDFNCNGFDVSCSTKYSRETIVSGLKALKDRSGITNEATYKFIIGPKNLKKLIAEDIAIATSKNWTIA